MIGPRLKDLGRWYSGGTPPSERHDLWDGDVPWLSGKDFDKTRLRAPTRFTTAQGAEEFSRSMPGGRSVLLLVRGMALAHGLPVAHLTFDAAINQDVRGLVVASGFDAKFIHYALVGRRAELDQHIDRAAHGTARVRDTLYARRIEWIPDENSQRVIAGLLDRECNQIASALDKLERLLAVETKRLAEERDRRLGKFPARRLKFLVDRVVDTAHATCPHVPGGDHWVVRTSAVRGGRIQLDGCYETDNAGFSEWTKRRVPLPGDVVFTREAPVGESAVIPDTGRWCIGQRSVLLVTTPDIDSAYLVMALYGARTQEDIILRSRTTTTAHLNVGEIGEIPVPLPSLDAQRDLSAWYERATARLHSVVSSGDGMRRRLAEYRDSLIHEAVTGKLDLTNVTERQMEERLHAASEGRLDEAAV